MKPPLFTPRECTCTCHEPGANMMHMIACCDGRCAGCGKYYRGLMTHRSTCQAFIELNKPKPNGAPTPKSHAQYWADTFTKMNEDYQASRLK